MLLVGPIRPSSSALDINVTFPQHWLYLYAELTSTSRSTSRLSCVSPRLERQQANIHLTVLLRR